MPNDDPHEAGGLVRPYLPGPPLSWDEPERPAGPTGVRPYLVTHGRAHPRDLTLEVESQVLATPAGLAARSAFAYEPREVLTACADPLSVAELAARLRLHLGVARILVDDLAALGYLTVMRPDHTQHDDADLIRRVIRGLRTI